MPEPSRELRNRRACSTSRGHGACPGAAGVCQQAVAANKQRQTRTTATEQAWGSGTHQASRLGVFTAQVKEGSSFWQQSRTGGCAVTTSKPKVGTGMADKHCHTAVPLAAFQLRWAPAAARHCNRGTSASNSPSEPDPYCHHPSLPRPTCFARVGGAGRVAAGHASVVRRQPLPPAGPLPLPENCADLVYRAVHEFILCCVTI